MSKFRAVLGKSDVILLFAIISVFVGFFTFTKLVRSSEDLDTTLYGAIMETTNPTGRRRPKADAGVNISEADPIAVNEEMDSCEGGKLFNGDGTQDLLIDTTCEIGKGIYKYRNVNIIAGGELTFLDEGDETHFWAKSILVESGGSLIAGTNTDEGAFGANQGTLIIHLYGSDGDKNGIVCKSPVVDAVPCGIDQNVWKNGESEKVGLPGGDDYFYRYTDPGDPNPTGRQGFSAGKYWRFPIKAHCVCSAKRALLMLRSTRIGIQARAG